MTMNYETGNNGLEIVVHSFPATLAFGQGSDQGTCFGSPARNCSWQYVRL